MKKSVSFLLLILAVNILSNSTLTSSFDEPTDIVSFSIFDNLQGWTQINASHDGYTVFSDNDEIDGLTSTEDFFPWYLLKDTIEQSDFFNLDLQEQNATVKLYINGEGQSNEIELQKLPEMNDTSTLAPTVLLVDSFLNKVSGKNIDTARVWPVTLHVRSFGFNPREWEFSTLIQRGSDNLDDVVSQNASLFATPQLDLNNINEQTLRNALEMQSVPFSIAASSTSTKITFEKFIYDYENSTEADPLSFIIMFDNGAFLGIQNTTKGWTEVIGQSEIINSWRIVAGLSLTTSTTSIPVSTTSPMSDTTISSKSSESSEARWDIWGLLFGTLGVFALLRKKR